MLPPAHSPFVLHEKPAGHVDAPALPPVPPRPPRPPVPAALVPAAPAAVPAPPPTPVTPPTPPVPEALPPVPPVPTPPWPAEPRLPPLPPPPVPEPLLHPPAMPMRATTKKAHWARVMRRNLSSLLERTPLVRAGSAHGGCGNVWGCLQ